MATTKEEKKGKELESAADPVKPVRPQAQLSAQKVRSIATDVFTKLIDSKQLVNQTVLDMAMDRLVEQLTPPSQDPRSYLVNVRWHLPNFAGIPMPAGYCFYAFDTFIMTEKEFGAGIELDRARELALERGALADGLTIEGLSVINISPEPALADE